MDLGLRGRVAVVTGASRGIGLGIARALATEGCDLGICARGEEALAGAAEDLRGAGAARVVAMPLDVTVPGAVERLVAETRRRLGGVDVAVANVGGSRGKPFQETDDSDWHELLELNLLSALRLARASIPPMRDAGGGSITFIASVWGREAAPPGHALYQTSKSALISAAKSLALELAPHAIRVNSVAPGSIRFPGGSWDRRAREDPDAMAGFVERQLPLGRFGRVEEVASLVAWLASPAASLVTGACLAVDGGQGRSLI